MAIKGVTKNGVDIQLKSNSEGELIVRSIIEREIEHESAEGAAFVWTSLDGDIDAGDTLLFIKNQFYKQHRLVWEYPL